MFCIFGTSMSNNPRFKLKEEGEHTLVWELMNEHRLKVSLMENDSVLDSRIYAGEIKNSQFETRVQFGIVGLPPLLCILSWSKMNLSIDSHNNMTMNRYATRLVRFVTNTNIRC